LASKWITSRQALSRFLQAQTLPAVDEQATPRTVSARNRAAERASRELERAGI
jgi:hypothetical protein